MSNSPQIDLSAGLTPKASNIDLSAGLIPKDQSRYTPASFPATGAGPFSGMKVDSVTGKLPLVAGAVGAGLGTVAGPAGVIGGAALGGAAGESLHQLLNRFAGEEAPQSSGEAAAKIGEQGAMQGFGAALGESLPIIAKGAGPIARIAAGAALKGIGKAEVPVASPLARWLASTRLFNLSEALSDLAGKFKGSVHALPGNPLPPSGTDVAAEEPYEQFTGSTAGEKVKAALPGNPLPPSGTDIAALLKPNIGTQPPAIGAEPVNFGDPMARAIRNIPSRTPVRDLSKPGSILETPSGTGRAAVLKGNQIPEAARPLIRGTTGEPLKPAPPVPKTPEDVDIWKQMTPEEKGLLQKEIDDWNSSGAGNGREGILKIPPDYVKLPAGWKSGDPVPAHYTGSEGTPNNADFVNLLEQSLRAKGAQ